MLAPGRRVRVRDDWPERSPPVHIRTPHYVRGREGVVAAWLGDFANPEALAFGRAAARCPLFHVVFEAAAVFDGARPGDDILLEIFGHWLEPA
jgi:nitrile hydratase